jgi:hypothetical protein
LSLLGDSFNSFNPKRLCGVATKKNTRGLTHQRGTQCAIIINTITKLKIDDGNK